MATKRTKGGSAGPPKPSAVALRYVLPSVEDLALPNVEGMTPRAAFNAFMDHAKRILHPSVLYDLLGTKWHDLGTKEPELSMIDARDRLREQCAEEQKFLRGQLQDLGNEVERYVGNNASHALIPERLGWMIGQVEAWEPERFHSDNPMDMPEEQRLAVTIERLRYRERWAGFEEGEREAEDMIARHLLGAIFNATELRVEFGQRLEEIAAALNSGRVAAAPARSTERLEWIPSTAAFEYIFSTLAKRGYFKITAKGGKEGEPNLTAFARALLLAFDVKGKDGNSLNAEQLRVRLSPGSRGKLSETNEGRFQIPASNELVIPNADELE